jgi:hypothetical protein
MTERETITSGPLAGYAVSQISRGDVFTSSELYVLGLNDRGELGYLAAQQEWVDDTGDPLEEAHQWVADNLAAGGFLPQFAEWFPAAEQEGGTDG